MKHTNIDKKTISAHELNKYAYCPYQWYYERFYGRKELRQLYQDRNKKNQEINQKAPPKNKKIEVQDTLNSNFARGLEFHKMDYERRQQKSAVWKIVLLVFLVAVVLGYAYIRYMGGMIEL